MRLSRCPRSSAPLLLNFRRKGAGAEVLCGLSAQAPDIYFTSTTPAVADAMLRSARVELDPPLVEISRQVAREGEVADRATVIEGDAGSRTRPSLRRTAPISSCGRSGAEPGSRDWNPDWDSHWDWNWNWNCVWYRYGDSNPGPVAENHVS